MDRNYFVIIGDKGFFENFIRENLSSENTEFFLDCVRDSDRSLKQETPKNKKANNLILRNDDYHGIVDAAHDRLGSLIEDITSDDAYIFIHNPPRVLFNYLQNQEQRGIITLHIEKEQYEMDKDPNVFSEKISEISKHIIGQEEAIKGITKSLWYLTTATRDKPYVIMLYGNSSLGKTELVREIAESFFDGKFLEKHLSMYQNNNYLDYFFGEKPNRRCLGFDLLERESNLIFLDEFDKCPQNFYSAFYTLFDNTLFKDATYDVDMSGTIIILTSNFLSEDEMKKYLGLPIYYRIDKFIHFCDFDTRSISLLTQKEIKDKETEIENLITPEEVFKAASLKIFTTGENARSIKYKVQQVIEDELFKEIQIKN